MNTFKAQTEFFEKFNFGPTFNRITDNRRENSFRFSGSFLPFQNQIIPKHTL